MSVLLLNAMIKDQLFLEATEAVEKGAVSGAVRTKLTFGSKMYLDSGFPRLEYKFCVV